MTRVTHQYVAARREAILDAAARLFARKGITSATMADIAAEADLSAGAIYRYFASKNELLRAVFDEAVTRNQQLFREEALAAPSPLEALKRVGRRVWVELDDRDALICDIQMALTAAREPYDFGIELSRNRESIRQLLEELIRAAQDAGEIDRSIDASALAFLLQATTSGVQMLKLDPGEDADIDAAFDLLARMVQGFGQETT